MQAYTPWIAMMAYAFHIVEEHTFDGKNRALKVLELPVSWDHFALVNGAVIVLGVTCSSVAWSCPVYARRLPAVMLINATFFHVFPFVTTRGRFSPGLGTAVPLFHPVGIWAYYGAHANGVLSFNVLTLSLVLGAVLMASPIVMLKLRLHPDFNQE